MAFPQIIDTSRVYGVAELTRDIKRVLETQFPPLWLRGELSGVLFHRSGHLYLTLKDAQSQIPGVMWRSRVQRLEFRPEDGEEVLVYGRLSVYERGGKYQFDIEVMQPGGRGALAVEFEKLKARLSAEGLFDPGRKRPIPRFPKRIGVVTSPSGAAVRDIVVTLTRRGFGIEVLLSPARVQGDGAAEEIAAALERLTRLEPKPDVIILGRGGGSIEDLWAFNEEVTVRAVAACPVPVIAGIGHETDLTLADLAADLRAPTPTGAAERATVDRLDLLQQVRHLGLRLGRAVTGTLENYHLRLENAGGGYGLRRVPDYLNELAQRLDDMEAAADRSLRLGFERREVVLERIAGRLEALSPLRVLHRGYAVVTKDSAVVTDASALRVEDRIEVILAKGKAGARVTSLEESHGGQ